MRFPAVLRAEQPGGRYALTMLADTSFPRRFPNRRSKPREAVSYRRHRYVTHWRLPHFGRPPPSTLTHQFGRGHWSSAGHRNGVCSRDRRHLRVLVARDETRSELATLRLATKTALGDRSVDYFERVRRPFIWSTWRSSPGRQRHGVGRRLLEKAKEVASAWPGDAIRLDAYEGTCGCSVHSMPSVAFREVGRVTYRGVPLVYFELLL